MARTREHFIKYAVSSLAKHGISAQVQKKGSQKTLLELERDGFAFSYEMKSAADNWDSYITFIRAVFSAKQKQSVCGV
jgi:hypothetical protein